MQASGALRNWLPLIGRRLPAHALLRIARASAAGAASASFSCSVTRRWPQFRPTHEIECRRHNRLADVSSLKATELAQFLGFLSHGSNTAQLVLPLRSPPPLITSERCGRCARHVPGRDLDFPIAGLELH